MVIMTNRPHVAAVTPCGAKTRNGTPCQLPPMHGKSRCKYHGGKSLSGIAAPSFVDGRHSKYMPTRLKEKYSDALNDPRITKFEDDFALIETLIADRLELIDTGESAKLWSDTRTEADKLFKAIHNEDYGGALLSVQHIQEMAGMAMTIHEAISSLLSLFEQKRKLRDSYQRHIAQADQSVRADKAMTMAMALLQAVKDNVSDQAVRNNIQNTFNRIVQIEALS